MIITVSTMDCLMSTVLKRSLRRALAALGLALALALGAAVPGFAAPLDDAKAAGLIGERPDGYVAAVRPPTPDISRLVQQVNDKRRAAYQDIATKTNTPIAQVGAVTAEKIKAKARPGELFMDAGGNWAAK
jgi:uncharacterized protein YdbL (DUF1318 family)